MDVTLDFVKNIIDTRYEDLPEEAIAAAKQEVMDSLATAIGGSSKAGVGELVDLVKEWGGKEQSTVIAYGLKCPAPHAAQVNGTMIHALDYDDGHQVALVHIGCVAVSTCFAVAERMGGKSGKEIITAMALGADFDARMAMASRPGKSLIASGWHPTTLFGYLVSAAMAGKLMGLDQEKMLNAIGIAYHQCAGNTQCGFDAALTKRMGPGLASRGGVTSALMAERGITGCKDSLEGKSGMFNLYHGGDYDRSVLTADLGKRFEGANIGDKPYPCCGFTHAFIDGSLSLRDKYSIRADRIREIRVYGGQSAYGLCEPLDVKRSPRNIVDAQFSVPWTVATALVKGKVTVEDFTPEAITKPEILNISGKVTGYLVEEMSRHGVGPGKVTLIMEDGKEYTEYVEHCLGSVERPMTFADCAAKFKECSNSSIKPLSAEKIDEITDLISNMEKLPDATRIIRMLG
ncbi:MAG: MmgE/PrpD family protein [Dehalococcoidales bacterium]|nr:MmgE/PrpD family protein [Dehalococcoidales bacterium]